LINRILIVGLGSIGKRHLKLARELVPTADIRVLRRQHTNEVPEYSNGCFFNIEDAIDFCPQAAVIASPASLHVEVAQRLAELGTHLLVEKPLSSSVDGVASLLQVCTDHNVVLITGYNLRFSPALSHFRRMLHDGIIGDVISVRCEVGQYLPSWRPDSDYRLSVSAQRKLGGGVLLELSHEIDYLRWIFGEVQWVSANLSRQSSLDINVEDSAHLALGFSPRDDGYQLVGSLSLDFIRHDPTRSCIAIGEKGSLRLNLLTGEVSLFEAGKEDWIQLFSCTPQRDDSYIAEWQNFIKSMARLEKPLVDGIDGLRVLEIVDATRKSSLLGEKVYLNVDSEFRSPSK